MKPVRKNQNPRGEIVQLKAIIAEKEIEIFRLKKIIDNVPGDIYWKDKEGVYLGINAIGSEHIRKMGFRWKSSDIIGKTDYDLYEKETADKFRENDLQVMHTGIESTREESNIIPSGEKIRQLSTKRPLWDEQGNIVGIVGNTVDITYLKKIEEDLRIAKDAAEKANKAKSEFIENMSHDIKTPLSGVIGMAELLRLELSDQNLKGYAENIKNSANQLLDLFNEVLDLIGKDSLEKSEHVIFEFKKLVQDVVNFLNPTIQDKKIQFKLSYSKGIANYFFGNRFHLYRIILNLLSNAIKFTDSGGQVSLDIRVVQPGKKRQSIDISVKDTGIGIPKESQEVIFDQYTRLTPAYTGQYKGSGLGLYIVKKMVEEMQGVILVESEVGKGSTFRVRLSLLISNERPEAPKESAIAEKKLTNAIRVLIVEDNPLAQVMAQKLLSVEGCQVDIAATGHDAVERFAHHQYQMVLMDIGLPDISGYEVTEKIRQHEIAHHQSPVLIFGLTAHVQKDGLNHGIASGINEMFSKPITPVLAKAMLQQVIGMDSEQSKCKNSVQAEEQEASELPAIDFDLGAKILGSSDIQVAKMMVDELVKMLPGDLERVRIAFQAGDNEKLKDIAHYIKGGASYCGTPRLKLSATALNDSIKTHADSALIQAAYENLCREIELVLSEYAKLNKT